MSGIKIERALHELQHNDFFKAVRLDVEQRREDEIARLGECQSDFETRMMTGRITALNELLFDWEALAENYVPDRD